MADGFKGRRSRAARAAISATHPFAWLVACVALGAVLLSSTYFTVRAPYGADEIRRWNAIDGHAYVLWRTDLETPVRYVVLVAMLVTTLYLFRRWRLAVLVRRPGPIAVAPLVNATGTQINEAELSTAFRSSLSRVDLNSPASIPGGGRSTEFLELLRGAAAEKSLLGSITGLLGLTWVTHAYEVTATARLRDDPLEPYGITVNVVTLPRGGAAPHTSWAPTWAGAVEKAAFAAGAAILPLTKLCRRPPWAGWRGLALPPQMFSAYLLAKDLIEQRRYDEALGTLYEILELDPLNLHLRLEIGSLQEQLQLFLDALETYDDLIALGSRADERNRHLWIDRVGAARDVVSPFRATARRRREGRALRTVGDGWRGRRATLGVRPAASPIRSTDRHNALLIGRYRYTLVLGFSEAVVDQWVHGVHGDHQSRRDTERERLRVRLTSRLAHYAHPEDGTERHDEGTGPLTAITPVLPLRSEADDEVRRRGQVTQDLQSVDAVPEPRPSTLDRLLAQRALQRASLAEVEQLRRDYRWFTGRRRPRNALSQRSLRVALVAAQVRLERVEALVTTWGPVPPPASNGSLSPSWPPDPHTLEQRVQHALGRNPFAVYDWQELYNAACVASIPLLPLPAGSRRGTSDQPGLSESGLSESGRVGNQEIDGHQGIDDTERRYARQAVRALERAADSSDSHFTANQRAWLAFADPDLIGFRASSEYTNFRARNLPTASAPVPVPENVHLLQLSGYVAGLLRRLAQELTACECATPGQPPAPDGTHLLRRLERDRRAWRYVRDACHEHRDWRARRELLEYVRTESGSPDLAVAYPTFPHPLIGDLSDVSDPREAPRLTVAGQRARQERVAQLVRIRDIAGRYVVAPPADAAAVARWGAEERRRVHANQIRAWQLLDQCLSTTFFTDVEQTLAERTANVTRMEHDLAAILATPTRSQVHAFTPTRVASRPAWLRGVADRRL